MIFGLAQAYIGIDFLPQSSMAVVAFRCDPGSAGLCLEQSRNKKSKIYSDPSYSSCALVEEFSIVLCECDSVHLIVL